MLIKLPEGTKCEKCNRVIQDGTQQYNVYTCDSCGAKHIFHMQCAPKSCPRCGGNLKNGYNPWIIY